VTIETTDDTVLGGKLKLSQPARGHRAGHDAILLAAAASSSAHAIDLGAGVGTAGLALLVRKCAERVTLVEIDSELAVLARENVKRNEFDARAEIVCTDALKLVRKGGAEHPAASSADLVLMNPPFNDPARQQSSPDARRRLAHVAGDGLAARWVAAAARLLRPQGVLTVIWRGAALEEIVAALPPAFGALRVLPVLPRPGAEPVRVLVRAVKGGAGRLPDDAPLVLNDTAGKPAPAAEDILRAAMPLPMAEG